MMSVRSWPTYLIRGGASWSKWFNIDNPFNGLEEETIYKVRQREVNVCSGGNVTDVECREVGTTTTFSRQQSYLDNTFYVPCNQTGLICRDEDQPVAIYCRDYEIRYRCKDGDLSQLTYMGGYASMGLGLVLIIFLICLLIANLKGNKCRNRHNVAPEDSRSSSVSVSDSSSPPPTYEMLFGELHHSPVACRTSTQRRGVELDIPSDGACSTITSGDPVDDPSVSLLDDPDIGFDGSRTGLGPSNPVRFLGMHIPVHQMFRSSSRVSLTPPPSYSDALASLVHTNRK